jgi:hypothetical protein
VSGKGYGLGGGLTFPVLRGEIICRGDDSDRKRQSAYGKKVEIPRDEKVRLGREAALEEHVVFRVTANFQALFRMNQAGIRYDRRDACDESQELAVVDLPPFREDGGNFPVFL